MERKVAFSKKFGLHYAEPEGLQSFDCIDARRFNVNALSKNGFYIAKLKDANCQEKVEALLGKLTPEFCQANLFPIFNTDIDKNFAYLEPAKQLELVPSTERTNSMKGKDGKVPIDLGRNQLTINSITNASSKLLKDVKNLSLVIGKSIADEISRDLKLESHRANMNLSILETEAGAPHQWIHSDMDTDKTFTAKQKIGLLALSPLGATFRIIVGSHKLHELDAENNMTWKAKKHVHIFHLKQFEYIVCEPTLYHSGTGAEELNHRLHFYMNMPVYSSGRATNDSTHYLADESLLSCLFSPDDIRDVNIENANSKKRKRPKTRDTKNLDSRDC
jgi:hypothetical protein